jgi:hypothetical protein
MRDIEKEAIETSEAEIAVHWGEEDYYYSSPQFVAQANMVDPKIIDRFGLENFPNCFMEYAQDAFRQNHASGAGRYFQPKKCGGCHHPGKSRDCR